VLEVINDCTATDLIAWTIPDVVTRVSKTDTIQNIFVSDSKAVLFGDTSYCGQRVYTFAPTYSFMTLNADDSLTLKSSDPNEVGTYIVTMTVSLLDFPLRPSVSIDFNLVIECEVFSISTVTLPPEKSSYRIGVDSQILLPFAFTEFPACGLTY